MPQHHGERLRHSCTRLSHQTERLAKREAKSINWPGTMLDTILSGIGRNPRPTTNEAGCIRPEGKNVPDVTTYHQ